jgi:glucose/arabinose dehydrogenase
MRRLIALVTVFASILLLGTAPARGQTKTIQAVPVIENLGGDVAFFTFLPDGRILYARRLVGQIYLFDPVSGDNHLFFQVTRLYTGPEDGLLGLAVHPDYPTSPYIYMYVSRRIANGDPHNQILRVTDSGGIGIGPKLIWQEDVITNIAHSSGKMVFGPDKLLYFVVGDAVNSANSQDLTNLAGKTHRITDRGAIPPSNPFPGSSIWTYGHRNSIGLAFDPQTNFLWESENGPDCVDEVNLIVKGANYGWGPLSDANMCTNPPAEPFNTNQDGPRPFMPKTWFTPTVAPVGISFCNGCGLSDSEGTLFMAEFNRLDIQRIVLTPDRRNIESITQIYHHPIFDVVSVESAPDGTMYFNDFSAIYKLVEV